MNTPAIHQAVRLLKHPQEMSWLCLPDSDLPEGISDLLRISASPEQLSVFADNNDFELDELSTALFNFIEKVMMNEKNSNEKILGIDKFSSTQSQNFHYELLMKIYSSDIQIRPNSDSYTALITNAHQQILKNESDLDGIRFSEYRKPYKSYAASTVKSESQASNSKTAIAVLSAITICSLVVMSGKFFGPSDNQIVEEISIEDNIVQDGNADPLQLMSSVSLSSKNIQVIEKPPIKATSTLLQSLLKDLEVAYENGDVETIKPILANAPEIKDQTEKQLNDKLETLFEITSERKMVLFDFNWTDISGVLKGKGSFISRYQLVGEKKWLTREGTALISAEKVDQKLKIKQLILKNQQID